MKKPASLFPLKDILTMYSSHSTMPLNVLSCSENNSPSILQIFCLLYQTVWTDAPMSSAIFRREIFNKIPLINPSHWSFVSLECWCRVPVVSPNEVLQSLHLYLCLPSFFPVLTIVALPQCGQATILPVSKLRTSLLVSCSCPAFFSFSLDSKVLTYSSFRLSTLLKSSLNRSAIVKPPKLCLAPSVPALQP